MNLAALSPTTAVMAAIQRASASNGVDFGYLLAEAKVESGLDADAKAVGSSARGLFQFTSGTWLDTIRKHGAGQGLGWAAAAVADGSAARDPAIRSAVLDLRRDPAAAAALAGAYAADNAAKIETSLGRPAVPADLYLAHFLGTAGALRFLEAKDADAGTTGESIAPAAARANPRVFFARDGAARSLASIYDRLAAKFGGQSVPPAGTGLPVARSTELRTAALPEAARTAYLLLAELSA